MDPDRLRHVRWIGGGSGAGKSTVGRRLATEHGLALYRTDDTITTHADRLTPEQAPMLAGFRAMDLDERWVHRDPVTMLDTFGWFRGEGFALIVEDLMTIGTDVIVEGFRLLPALVAPLLGDRSAAVWLLPSPEFRRAVFDRRRGTPADIPGRTHDPERARHNLLERDRMFTDRVAAETDRLGLASVRVGGRISEDALTRRVGRRLGLG